MSITFNEPNQTDMLVINLISFAFVIKYCKNQIKMNYVCFNDSVFLSSKNQIKLTYYTVSIIIIN